MNLNILTVVTWAFSIIAQVVMFVIGMPAPAELHLVVGALTATVLALLGAAVSKKKEEPKSE